MKKVCLTLALGLLAACVSGPVQAQSPAPHGYALSNITKFDVGPRAAARFNELRAMTWTVTEGAVAPIVAPNACANCCDSVWDGYCQECGHGGCSERCQRHRRGDCGCGNAHGDCGCNESPCSKCGSLSGTLLHSFDLLGGHGKHGSCGCSDQQSCGCNVAHQSTVAPMEATGETMIPWSTPTPPAAPSLPVNELPDASASLQRSNVSSVQLVSLETQQTSAMDVFLQGQASSAAPCE